MSTLCNVDLPGTVRLTEVGHVLAVASGTPRDTITYHPVGPPYLQAAIVKFTGTNHLGDINGDVIYFFEDPDRPNFIGKVLSAPATPFWLAVAHKVADFYGGVVDYNDEDDRRDDYTAPGILGTPPSEPSVAWNTIVEDALGSIAPVTKADVDAMVPHARYKDSWTR